MTTPELAGTAIGAGIMWAYYRRTRPRPVPAPSALGGEFEVAMGAFLRHFGWLNVQELGGSGDNGADILATAPDGRLVVIQCKFARGAKVGSPVVRSVIGARVIYSADGAVVATTGSFTGPALALAAEMGVECWDGAFLRRF